jgi:hypothetical protein
MTPERWQQVKAVLATALDMHDAERSDYLDKNCAGDESLRMTVEQLLQSLLPHKDLRSRFDSSACRYRCSVPSAALSGTRWKCAVINQHRLPISALSASTATAIGGRNKQCLTGPPGILARCPQWIPI